MKKLSSFLVIIFSMFLVLGFAGCSGDLDTSYWLEGEKDLMNLLEVDVFTPVKNTEEITEYLRWEYIEGGNYVVKAGETEIASSNSEYNITTGKYVEFVIPEAHLESELEVYYTTSSSTALSAVQNVWKVYQWNKIENASYYEVKIGSKTFISTEDVYNRNQDETYEYNCFEEVADYILFRTKVADRNNVSSIKYVELAERGTKNAFFTKMDSQLSQMFNGGKAADTNTTNVIKYNSTNNIYKVIETKYLYLIRSCFINLWEYGRLLETVPPIQTEDNEAEIAKAFADLKNKVLNLQAALDEIEAEFDNFKKYFTTFDQFNADYLSNYNTAHGAQLRRFEEAITPKLIYVIDFSEYFQEFCEKYYNVNPNITDLLETIELECLNPTDLTIDKQAYEEKVANLIKDGVISGKTVKYMAIAYQNRLLRPVYNFYFNEYGGRFSTEADPNLFNKLVALNDKILKMNTELKNVSIPEDISDTDLIKKYETIIDTLKNYSNINKYVETEKDNFLKGLEVVDLNDVKKVEWTKTTIDGNKVYEWTPLEDGRKPYILITYTKDQKTKYLQVRDFVTKTINGKTRVYEDTIKTYFNIDNADAVELYSIVDDAYTITYNERINSYILEVADLGEKYVNTILNLNTSSSGYTLFYQYVDRVVIIPEVPEELPGGEGTEQGGEQQAA